MSDEQTDLEAENARLREVGNALASALNLVSGELHAPVGRSRAFLMDGRYYMCLIESPDAMDALAEPVADWIIVSGMSTDDLRQGSRDTAVRMKIAVDKRHKSR